MKRASFWVFVIGSAALLAYLLDLFFLSSPALQGAPERSLSRASGSPILSPMRMPQAETSHSRPYTNEELYRDLQKQTIKMGIQDILPPNSKDENQGSDASPFSPGLFQNSKDKGVYINGKTPGLLKDAQSNSGQ